jgi:hypothetical protein
VFDVSSSGEVIVPITAKLYIHRPTLFAVTVEKPGGVVVSKRERIGCTEQLRTNDPRHVRRRGVGFLRPVDATPRVGAARWLLLLSP